MGGSLSTNRSDPSHPPSPTSGEGGGCASRQGRGGILSGVMMPGYRYIICAAVFVAVAAVGAAALLMAQPAGATTDEPSPLDEHESQDLRWLQDNHPELYSQLGALHWVADGLSDAEIANLEALLQVGRRDIATMEALAPMPFLSTADATDTLALRSIHWLAITGLLAPLTSHETFLDGIDDTETTLVAAAGTVVAYPWEIASVLTPGYMSVQTSGTNSGVRLSILRPGWIYPAPETIGTLERTVEFVEMTMGLPLPVEHVILVLYDYAVLPGAAGVNFGFGISFLPYHEQPEDTFLWWTFRTGLAHEVAHYYWRLNERWLDEGMAVIFERLYGLYVGLSPGQLQSLRRGCEAHDLQMLSENPEFVCNYYLGPRLFDELRDAMTEAEFSQAMLELYNLTIAEQDAGGRPGIDEVRQAFSAHAEIVEKHWSGGLNAPENRPPDEGIERITHDLVEWEERPAYDESTGMVTLKGTLLEDAVFTDIGQRTSGYPSFTLVRADSRRKLGSILPPVSGPGWILDDPADVVATSYEVAGQEFSVTFQFPLYGDPTDYVVVVWGYLGEHRIVTIRDGADPLGYSRIRIAEPAVTTGSVVGDRYDANKNGKIEEGEVRDAIADWFTEPVGSVVTTAEVRELIFLYFMALDEG